MTEFAFFAGKEDRWGNNMKALWGNLGICPCLNYLELPYHPSGELLSVSHLKIWGDIQEPHNDMAYLLVCTGDASGAKSYGLALVWISPHQVWASTMEEAIGTLSVCISSGPDWPYALAQLHEGSNHTPLPKDKHIGVLPWGRMEESPHGWISQLKVCQLLSAGPWAIYPVGLNGGDQPVTFTLPEPLHSGSSITIDEHLHIRIDIPLLSSEEPECTTLPLGRAHAIPSATTPKTPWKPRIILMAEVNDLLKKMGVWQTIPAMSQSTLPQKRQLLQKQSCPYPIRWRSQPHQLTLPLKLVWRRGRLPWRVILSMFLSLWLHTAAAVVVQWWTSQNLGWMPT